MRRRREPGASGFTIIEVLISIAIITIGVIGVIALLTQSVKVAGEVVEDSFAATIGRSVYEAVREGARKRAFIVQESGRNVRGLEFVYDGVVDGTSTFVPPPLPQTMNDTAALVALRASDFTIFLPPASPYTSGEVYFVYPRPTDPATENSWAGPPTGGQDDSFYVQNPIAARQKGPPDYAGIPNRFDIQRVYWIKNRNDVAPGGAYSDAADQYGFAIAVRRASVPKLTSNGGPIQWMNPDGTPNGGLFPPNDMAPADGFYQVEVMVFRNFEKDPASRHHQPVPGGHFVGNLAVGP